jgi:mRNA interferase RelE/StbE
VAYRVELRPAALRDLKSLPREVLDRVSEKIDSLPENPRPPGVEKLSGSEDSCRVRVGDYRILYRIVDEALLVLVVAVRHRKEAYRRV